MHDRIKAIRKIAGISQEKFGEMLGISRNVVANIECNRYEASATLIELICLKFHVNKNWLMNGIGDMYQTNDDADIDCKIMNLYNSLPDEHKTIVRNFLSDMLANMPDTSKDEKY